MQLLNRERSQPQDLQNVPSLVLTIISFGHDLKVATKFLNIHNGDFILPHVTGQHRFITGLMICTTLFFIC